MPIEATASEWNSGPNLATAARRSAMPYPQCRLSWLLDVCSLTASKGCDLASAQRGLTSIQNREGVFCGRARHSLGERKSGLEPSERA